MSVLTDADLSELRAIALSNMVDSCTIKRRTGTVPDPDTGAETPTYDTFYPDDKYPDGPCLFLMASGAASDQRVGEEPAAQVQPIVCVPWDSTPAQSDDVVTITASQDAALVGRTLRVESFYGKSMGVERRYVCEESTTPGP